MVRYIDVELLRKDINNLKTAMADAVGEYSDGVRFALEHFSFILDSLQQDETQVDKMLCSQIWWEERGWIMIPPDATIEGIDSLLKQVRKKLQQEQPEVNLVAEYDEQFDSDPVYGKLINRNAGIAVARHFWNKGFNARKEEGK